MTDASGKLFLIGGIEPATFEPDDPLFTSRAKFPIGGIPLGPIVQNRMRRTFPTACSMRRRGDGCRRDLCWNLIGGLRSDEDTWSGSKVNRVIGEFLGQALPSVDFAHSDLT